MVGITANQYWEVIDKMQIDILCSDPTHPVNQWLAIWIEKRQVEHDIRLYRKKVDLRGGDVLFLISCAELINQTTRASFAHSLVIHASDLPKGRGWSPHVWSILEGATELTVTLLNAEDKVDSGAVWAKEKIKIPRHYVFDEINAHIFDCELRLMEKALVMIAKGEAPFDQDNIGASYYPRRTSADSEISPDKSISEVFELLRISDPDRYPAFVRYRNHVYSLTLKKMCTDETDRD